MVGGLQVALPALSSGFFARQSLCLLPLSMKAANLQAAQSVLPGFPKVLMAPEMQKVGRQHERLVKPLLQRELRGQLARREMRVDSSTVGQVMDWWYALPGEQVWSRVPVALAAELSRPCHYQLRSGDDAVNVSEVQWQRRSHHSVTRASRYGHRLL